MIFRTKKDVLQQFIKATWSKWDMGKLWVSYKKRSKLQFHKSISSSGMQKYSESAILALGHTWLIIDLANRFVKKMQGMLSKVPH